MVKMVKMGQNVVIGSKCCNWVKMVKTGQNGEMVKLVHFVKMIRSALHSIFYKARWYCRNASVFGPKQPTPPFSPFSEMLVSWVQKTTNLTHFHHLTIITSLTHFHHFDQFFHLYF